MKKLLVIALSLFALSVFAAPAQAEEKNPNKLMKMLEDKLGGKLDFLKDAKYKERKEFKEFIKYTCQKGSMLGGVFGVCRSGEGIVCGAKKEAYVACAVICGVLGKDMAESAGFAESKCVTKHGKDKWQFADHHAAVTFAKAEIKTKAQSLGPVVKLCGVIKPIAAKLPAELKEFAEACP